MLVTDGRSMMLSPVSDGTEILMEPPPQGGFVMYIGARARNVDACGIELTGTLRDPDTLALLGRDGRNTDFVKTPDGWAQSDARDNSNEANVNACPAVVGKDRPGGEFLMEMTVIDREKRTATVSHRVKLACDPALDPAYAAECACECLAGYTPGKCGLDASTSD